MKKLAFVAALVALIAAAAVAQTDPDIRSLLSSTDAEKRESAARDLAGHVPLQPDVKTALIDLLVKEHKVMVAQPAGFEEGYGEYVGWLTGEVMKIADAEPNRSDVWYALLGTIPGQGNSEYGKWLGTHGDKVLPYLLVYARDRRTDDLDLQNRADVLASLAQIVVYERRPDTAHHLAEADVQRAASVIREGIGDPEFVIRLNAVAALEIMGDPRDLPLVERIALTDAFVAHDGGNSGTETHFPLREFARGAAERMRAKLAAKGAVH